MTLDEDAPPRPDPQDIIRQLQAELARTYQKALSHALSQERRLAERTHELQAAQEELAKTSSGLLHLTLELEDRVAERTEEIRKLNAFLEQRVAERTAQLEAVNQELEAFTYSISHDLRTPLRQANGFLDHLAAHLGQGLQGEAAHCLDRVKVANQQMDLLIKALLDLSLTARRPLALQPLDLDKLVGGLVETFKGELQGRQVSWTLGALPVIQGDLTLVRTLFQNLIGNAVKFTGRLEQARIEVGRAEGPEAEAVVFVRDNGAGFDPAYAPNLFGAFQRLHPQEAFEGTGIGLAIVRKIVQRHGGRVWADGRPDGGATFYAAFPSLPVG
jgi:light-regulated signal transduction histidine kinase (bacteriophytochrome)